MNIDQGRIWRGLAFSLPIIGAGVLGLLVEPPAEPPAQTQSSLQTVEVASSEELAQLFQRLGYRWPPEAGPTVPRIELKALPADLSQISQVEQRKSLFFRSLLPLVLAENQRLAEQRKRAQALLQSLPSVDTEERRWLQALAEDYGVEGDLSAASHRSQLLQRVDELPPALVLAQAANESGWGTSRFAHQANNLFGVWTYGQDGLVPQQRREGARHSVRKYPTLLASVRHYMHNLNTHRAYGELRHLRAQMREADKGLEPIRLAAGLQHYSERGDAYIREIRSMIRVNDLHVALNEVRLQPPGQTTRVVRTKRPWQASQSPAGA